MTGCRRIAGAPTAPLTVCPRCGVPGALHGARLPDGTPVRLVTHPMGRVLGVPVSLACLVHDGERPAAPDPEHFARN